MQNYLIKVFQTTLEKDQFLIGELSSQY